MKKLLLWGTLVFGYVFFFTGTAMSQVDLYLNQVNVYFDEYGKISLYTLPDTIQQINRATILVGTGPDSVFDYHNDVDVEDSTQLLDNPTFGDYEIYGSYNNNYSGAPPNVLEKENIYCWQDQNSFIVKYTIVNRESSSINAIVGLDLITQVEDSYSGGDTVTYSSLSKIISVRKTESVGFKPLSENFKSVGDFVWFSGYSEDTTYYKWLTYSAFDTLFITDPNDPNVDDPVIIPSFTSRTIAPGDSVIYYIAIAYGANETEMLTSLEQAQKKYNQITAVRSELNNIPSNFVLEQNYPNPFNPSTNISFGLPHRSNVVLKIFNSLGQQVAELINESLEAGTHSYNFNASKLASGIYIYSLQTEEGIISKKMTFLK